MVITIVASTFCCKVEADSKGFIIVTAPVISWSKGLHKEELRGRLEERGVLRSWKETPS